VVVSAEHQQAAIDCLTAQGETVSIIGQIEQAETQAPSVQLR